MRVGDLLPKISKRGESMDEPLRVLLHRHKSLVAETGTRNIELCQRTQSLLFVLCQRDVTGQPQHLEKLYGLLVNVRENKLRPDTFGGIYDAQKNRDTDTVNQLGVSEIDDERRNV